MLRPISILPYSRAFRYVAARHCVALALLALFFVGLGAPAAPAAAQQIWLAPEARAADLLDMFHAGSPWDAAASHIQVFKFYGNPFIAPTPQADIDRIVADLKRRHIAIAVETGVMDLAARPRPPCGGWGLVEGYGPVKLHELIARKIKQAGGTISYIAMDEPLFYGHYFKGRPAGQPGCRLPIDDVVKLIAPSLNVYTREFPGVRIGDIEPTNLAGGGPAIGAIPAWRDDMTAWASGFRAAFGRPLAFLQIDVPWTQRDAPERAHVLYDWAHQLEGQGLIGALGVIYDGNRDDPTDAAWVQTARDHMRLIGHDICIRPDQVVIQSWRPHPSHTMPDTAPDTLTGLVNFYVSGAWSK